MKMMSPEMHSRFDQIAELTTFPYRSILSIRQVFHDSRVVLHVSGKLRRFVLVHFRKKYVQRQLSARQGACRQCGTCCNLLFTCPMLTKQGRCLAYGTCRPQSCKVFPIAQQDIDEVELCGKQCGYRFNGEDSAKAEKIGRF